MKPLERQGIEETEVATMAKPTTSTPLLSGRTVSDSQPSVTDYGGTLTGNESTFQDSEQLQAHNQPYKLSVGLILFMAFCERMAFYSVLNNMVLFCVSKLNFMDFNASMAVWIFSGTAFMITPLIGGLVADSVCGRYNTILGSGFIFFIGKIILFYSSGDFKEWFGHDSESVKRALFITSLVVIAIGSGGMQANIGPFGAHQVAHKGQRTVQTFYHWLYWIMNLGAIVASTVVVCMQTKETKDGFWHGYLLSLSMLFAGLLVFGCGRRAFKHKKPSESVLKNAITDCYDRCNRRQGNVEEGSSDIILHQDVATVLKILPIYGFVALYWMSNSQSSTSLFLQSVRLNIGKVPPALLATFNPVMVVLFIPLMDLVVYPKLIRSGINPSLIQRIGFGLFMAVLALLYAGGLEMFRKRNDYFIQEINLVYYNASNISVFHQVPIFALLGLSEVWTSVSGFELAYTQTSDNMQGLVTGLFLMTIGLGSFYSTIWTAIVRYKTDWYPEKSIQTGHLEYYLFPISGITFVFFVIYVLVNWFRRTWNKRQPFTQNDGTHDRSS